MSKKTEEFLEKLAPCIEKGNLEACVDKVSKLAEEMGIDGEELLDLFGKSDNECRPNYAYVLALVAAPFLKDEKQQARAYAFAGIAAQSLRNYGQSEIQYKISIEKNPDNARVYNNYANILAELGRKDEAEKQYLLAIEKNPNLAIVHYNYANLLKELGRLDEAEKQYRLAIEKDPEDAAGYNNCAILLAESGRLDEAEKYYKLAIEKNPKFALPHYNYANLLVKLGRLEGAEDHYKKTIEIDPKYAAAHNNYAILLRGLERLSEADSEVRTALQIEPSNPYALSTLGDILADEEYFEEAEERYKEALRNSGMMDKSALSEVHNNNLGYVYFQLKQYKKAEKEFQKSDELSGNVKAIRNLRAIKKAENIKTDLKWGLPRAQKCFLVSIILILLGFCYYLFLFWKTEDSTGLLSDTMFVAQSSILMGLLIFVLFANQLARLKVGAQGVELEMSTEHRTVEARSLSAETAPMLERS